VKIVQSTLILLRNDMDDVYNDLRRFLPQLGLFGLALHGIYYSMNVWVGVIEVPWLRLVSVLLLLILVFRGYFERRATRLWMPYIVVPIIFFIIPYFSIYVLIQAVTEIPDDSVTIAGRQVQLGFTLACMVILVPQALLCCLGVIVSFAAALASCLFFVGPIDIGSLSNHLFVITPMWAGFLLVGLYYGRNREVLEREKNRAMTAIGSNIGHELRTPLLGIRTRIGSVAEILPTLIESYTRSTATKERQISNRKLELLEEACSDIEEEASIAATLIDIFIANLSGRPAQPLADYAAETFLVSKAAMTARRRYPFASEREQSIVEISVLKDFEVRGSEVMLVHVFFNLIKNALHFSRQISEPKIEIRVGDSSSDRARTIIVRDNGQGISPSDIGSVFRRFYTTDTGRGTGIGLSFCETAMRSMGGSVSVQSKLGEFTIFRLKFPDIAD